MFDDSQTVRTANQDTSSHGLILISPSTTDQWVRSEVIHYCSLHCFAQAKWRKGFNVKEFTYADPVRT